MLVRTTLSALAGHLTALALATGPVHADNKTQTCGGLSVIFETMDPALVQRACRTLDGARPLFEVCGLWPTVPSPIGMRLGREADAMACLAMYHCDAEMVEIMSPDGFANVLDAENPFAALPPLALFDSLVVHEIVHALLDQMQDRPRPSSVADEYIADALQLESLPARHRATLLNHLPTSRPARLETLTEKTLMFSPDVFALSAWRHFDKADNGCAFVDRILKGDINFAQRP